MMKLGFIGAGNMAKAIMGGVLKNGIFKPEEVIASDLYVPGLEAAKESLGINITTDNKEVEMCIRDRCRVFLGNMMRMERCFSNFK